MECHICSEKTESFIDDKTDISYYYCDNCEYIFKSKDYYQTLELQKERYDYHQNDEHDIGYSNYFKRFLNQILPHVSNVKNALDFGCGRTPLLSSILEDKGTSCDYYDPIYYPDVHKLKKSYDLIIAIEVFEHLHNPRDTFIELMNKLTPKGYLAIQTQFHSNNIEEFKQWYYHHDVTHIVFFRSKSFQVLCQQYGCICIYSNDKNIVLIQKN